MDEFQAVMAAYLYLCALEHQGLGVQNFNIHGAWIEWCRNRDYNARLSLVGAATQEGFWVT